MSARKAPAAQQQLHDIGSCIDPLVPAEGDAPLPLGIESLKGLGSRGEHERHGNVLGQAHQVVLIRIKGSEKGLKCGAIQPIACILDMFRVL